ncbi:MAG: hypothetical protein ACOCX5_05870 [Chloroflexota bacterium]
MGWLPDGIDSKIAKDGIDQSPFPKHKPHRRERSIPDPYLPYLEQHVQDGCENAQQLWREIQQLGYPGTDRQVMKWLQLKRTSPVPCTPHAKRSTRRPTTRKATLPSSKQLAWLMVRDTGSLSHTEQFLLSHLHQHDAPLRLHDHVQVFAQMVKRRQVEKLDEWLDVSDDLGLYQLQTFTTELRQDYAAVGAAIETHWRNGQTGGQSTDSSSSSVRCMDELSWICCAFGYLLHLDCTQSADEPLFRGQLTQQIDNC